MKCRLFEEPAPDFKLVSDSCRLHIQAYFKAEIERGDREKIPGQTGRQQAERHNEMKTRILKIAFESVFFCNVVKTPQNAPSFYLHPFL